MSYYGLYGHRGTRQVTFHVDLEATIDGTPASGRFSFVLPSFSTKAHASSWFQIYVSSMVHKFVSDLSGTLDGGYTYKISVEVDDSIQQFEYVEGPPDNLIETLGFAEEWGTLPVSPLFE